MASIRIALNMDGRNVFDAVLPPEAEVPIDVAALRDARVGIRDAHPLIRCVAGSWYLHFRIGDSVKMSLTPDGERAVVVRSAAELAQTSDDLGDGWYRKEVRPGERGVIEVSAAFRWNVIFLVLPNPADPHLSLTTWDGAIDPPGGA